MGKNRELASYFSNKIWRTVVVAGAMLVAPAACGGGNKPAPVAPKTDEGAKPEAKPDPAVEQAADGVKDPQPDPDAAQKMIDEKKAADEKAEADKKAADEKALADQKAADEAAKKRPRGGGNKPTGRGFILS